MTSGELGVGSDDTARKFLIDTNVFLALEPFDGNIEGGQRSAAAFMRLAQKQSHKVYMHPASRDELSEGLNQPRTRQRLAELDKHLMLSEVPISSSLQQAAGSNVADGSNHHRDLRILAALDAGAVHHLVTDDRGLHRRAARAGLGHLVLTVADAAAMLADLEPGIIPPPPRVVELEAYALDTDQEIFASLREDYAGFDEWLDKVRTDSDARRCYVIKEPDGSYAAIAILKKREADCDYPQMPSPISKISTFKVMMNRSGNRYGELLLKAVMSSHRADEVSGTYVEVFSKHSHLVDFLSDFGFKDSGYRTGRDELVLVKRYSPTEYETADLGAFEFHRTFGPIAISPKSRYFVVPIQPRWHEQLFPESLDRSQAGEQLLFDSDLFMTTHPWGNALKKAYICNSNIRQVGAGDVVLFYQSGGEQAVMAIGVVEQTLRSFDPDEVLQLVGGRTVYAEKDVREMCNHSHGALVLLFRQDRMLDPMITLGELVSNGAITAAPQSIVKVKKEGLDWLRHQLNVPQ